MSEINLNLVVRKPVFGVSGQVRHNRAAQPQKMARGLKFCMKRDFTIYVAKTKALISFAVTAKLICVFVFAYAKSRFSHDADQSGNNHFLGIDKVMMSPIASCFKVSNLSISAV